MAAVEQGVAANNFVELTKDAHCAITVDNGDRPYQGIVAIDGESLSSSLAHYFERSVQVPSHIALIANEDVAAGILVQQVPGEPIDEHDWNQLQFLIETLTIKDFDGEAGLDLIAKLFAEDDVRVHAAKPVRFQCRCSVQKVEDVLKMLGEKESREALDENDSIEVICEYCGEKRVFDSVDVSRLFAENVVTGPQSVQ